MGRSIQVSRERAEELHAELATAALRAASQQDFKGAFIDVELDLWSALQSVLHRSQSASQRIPNPSFPATFPVGLVPSLG